VCVSTYRISSYSCRSNYYFLEVGVRQLFKEGNYSREETIKFLLAKSMINHANIVEMKKNIERSIDIA